MARTRNQAAYGASRDALLDAGEALFRARSFAETGINDVLKAADVPKGSFYHYFDSKQNFGLAVARRYADRQNAQAQQQLRDPAIPALDRLKAFFEGAMADMARREFTQGCLMCNLSTELADAAPAFQQELSANWQELSAEIAACLEEVDLAQIGLAHLNAQQAADWLLNSWSGALTRMKTVGNDQPLQLFLTSIFGR